jgi:hypothetical protein
LAKHITNEVSFLIHTKAWQEMNSRRPHRRNNSTTGNKLPRSRVKTCVAVSVPQVLAPPARWDVRFVHLDNDGNEVRFVTLCVRIARAGLEAILADGELVIVVAVLVAVVVILVSCAHTCFNL